MEYEKIGDHTIKKFELGTFTIEVLGINFRLSNMELNDKT